MIARFKVLSKNVIYLYGRPLGRSCQIFPPNFSTSVKCCSHMRIFITCLTPRLYMDTQKRRFSPKDKREILEKVDNLVTTAVLKEFGISHDLFGKWKKWHEQHQLDRRIENKLKRLMKENERLKKIVSDLTLELDWKE